MGDFNAPITRKPKGDNIPAVTNPHICDKCGGDVTDGGGDSRGKIQRRIVVRINGKARRYAAGEILNWKYTTGEDRLGTDWEGITFKRSGCTFVRWINQCNDCFKWKPALQHGDDWSEAQHGSKTDSIGKVAERTAEQKQALRNNMRKNNLSPKDSHRAYMLINRIMAPKLLGSVDASAEEKAWAAKYVLWHWPQASNETMPSNMEKLCKELVCQ